MKYFIWGTFFILAVSCGGSDRIHFPSDDPNADQTETDSNISADSSENSGTDNGPGQNGDSTTEESDPDSYEQFCNQFPDACTGERFCNDNPDLCSTPEFCAARPELCRN